MLQDFTNASPIVARPSCEASGLIHLDKADVLFDLYSYLNKMNVIHIFII